MRPYSPTHVGAFVFFIIICAAPTFARHGAAPSKVKLTAESPRMTFQSLYTRTDEALDNKDLDGGMQYHDPDFIQVQPNGDETDLGDVRYELSSWLDLAKTVHSTTSVVSASIQGVTGTALVKSSVTMVMINPDTRAKSYFVDRVVSKDTWSNQSDGWMLLRSRIISESTTNDGRKVYDRNNPFAPPPAPTDDDDNLAPEPPVDTPSTNSGDNS